MQKTGTDVDFQSLGTQKFRIFFPDWEIRLFNSGNVAAARKSKSIKETLGDTCAPRQRSCVE
jgi:hypothetical protein